MRWQFGDQDIEVHQVGYLTNQLGTRAVEPVNRYGAGPGLSTGQHEPAAGAQWTVPQLSTEAVLALQGEVATRRTHRRLQVRQNPRQHLFVQRGRRSARARQPKERHKDVYERLVAECRHGTLQCCRKPPKATPTKSADRDPNCATCSTAFRRLIFWRIFDKRNIPLDRSRYPSAQLWSGCLRA